MKAQARLTRDMASFAVLQTDVVWPLHVCLFACTLVPTDTRLVAIGAIWRNCLNFALFLLTVYCIELRSWLFARDLQSLIFPPPMPVLKAGIKHSFSRRLLILCWPGQAHGCTFCTLEGQIALVPVTLDPTHMMALHKNQPHAGTGCNHTGASASFLLSLLLSSYGL